MSRVYEFFRGWKHQSHFPSGSLELLPSRAVSSDDGHERSRARYTLESATFFAVSMANQTLSPAKNVVPLVLVPTNLALIRPSARLRRGSLHLPLASNGGKI